MTTSPTSDRFRYGWIVLAVAAGVLVVGAGTRAAPGALLLAMRADTGWSTADIAVAGAFGLLLLGLAGPVSGIAIDRLGVRWVAVGSMLLTAVGMAGSAVSRELWGSAPGSRRARSGRWSPTAGS
jgi:hypothetical protein